MSTTYTFNGFTEGEVRVRELRPQRADGGHSIIKHTTRRPGDRHVLRHTFQCECGSRFSSSVEEAARFRHARHARARAA